MVWAEQVIGAGRIAVAVWTGARRGVGELVGMCVVGELCAAAVGMCIVGKMLTPHNYAPEGLRVPWRMAVPSLSWPSSWYLSRCSVQSASHNFPRLRRLCMKPGMMWPIRAC